MSRTARILTTEKDNEMTQTTNISIRCDSKSEAESSPNFYQNDQTTISYPPPITTRDIDLTTEIQDKEQEIKFLELLLHEYENKPVVMRGLLICRQKNLLELIKIACNADKVEAIIDDTYACTDCCTDGEYQFISSILVTKNGKTQDFKYSFNEIYSKFRKHGINLKLVY